MKNTELISVKANLEKKSEKNFTALIKFNLKEGLKHDKHDVKANFFRIVKFLLIDKYNIHMIGNDDDQFCEANVTTLITLMS